MIGLVSGSGSPGPLHAIAVPPSSCTVSALSEMSTRLAPNPLQPSEPVIVPPRNVRFGSWPATGGWPAMVTATQLVPSRATPSTAGFDEQEAAAEAARRSTAHRRRNTSGSCSNDHRLRAAGHDPINGLVAHRVGEGVLGARHVCRDP